MKRIIRKMLVTAIVFAVFCASAAAGNTACPSCGNEFVQDPEYSFCPFCGKSLLRERFRDAQEGSTVTFGRYEQDNAEENGREPIEWIVLRKQDDRMLLLSRYGLDTEPSTFIRGIGTQWEDSRFRAWLNGTFLETAFSPSEQEEILITDVDNSKEQGFSCILRKVKTGDEPDTQDQVFLLSVKEFVDFFAPVSDKKNWTSESAATRATDYARMSRRAVARKAEGEWYDGNSDWWLRSPGISSEQSTAYITSTGMLKADDDVGGVSATVRPAIWIRLAD